MKKALVVAVSFFILYPVYSHASIKYVKTDGNDGNGGSSWNAAKKTIQAAINNAGNGDTVLVSKGVYQEKLTLKAGGVALYGGFNVGAAFSNTRDFKTNVTAIDGGDTAICITIPANAAASTRVDGFMIRRGNASPGIGGQGGAILCLASSAGTIINNSIIGNYSSSSGAIFCETGSLVQIINNRIIGNYALNGPAISCGSTSKVKIVSNLIASNKSTSRGAVLLISTSTGTLVFNNTIVGNNGSNGAGLNAFNATATIANNIIAFNSTGVSFTTTTGTITFRNNCVFGNNGVDYTGLSANSTNKASDPGFADINAGNFHILSTSSCKDAGSTIDTITKVTDFDNETRVSGTAIDIGADEYVSTTPAWAATIVRVSPTGSDTNSGSSWTSAKRTIQEAVFYASSRSGEVWVQKGTYNENITVYPWAYLYGGFNSSDNIRTDRDFRTDTTKINGGYNGKGIIQVTTGMNYSTIDGFYLYNGLMGVSGKMDMQTGGAIFCDGASPTITNNIITRCKALSKGGAIYLNKSNSIIAGNIIFGDSASVGGGAICAENSCIIIHDNFLYRNYSGTNGGGIYLNNDSTTKIINNTIVCNKTPTGTYNYGAGIYMAASMPLISSNIIAFNTSGIYKLSNGSGMQILRNNCVFGNALSQYQNNPGATLAPGATDIALNPKFIDTTGSNFHLDSISPCINVGNNADVTTGSLDIDGQTRIYNNLIVDMGADESPYAVYVPPQPTGNVTINGGATLTTSVFVELTLAASSPTGTIDSMTFRTLPNTNWSGWEPFGTKRVWLLSSGNVAKSVVVAFHSTVNEIFYDTAQITLAAATPIIINTGADTTRSVSVSLNVGGIRGIGNIVDSMAFTQYGIGWTPYQKYDTLKSWTLLFPNKERKKVYVGFKTRDNRSWYLDSTTIYLKMPQTITINKGAAITTKQNVSLRLLADSAFGSRPDSMTWRNDGADWNGWHKYDTLWQNWSLSNGYGTKKVAIAFWKLGAPAHYWDSANITFARPAVVINKGEDTTYNSSTILHFWTPFSMTSVDSIRWKNENGNFSVWQRYDTLFSGWTLSSGDGIKKVIVDFKSLTSGQEVFDTATIYLKNQAKTIFIDNGADTVHSQSVKLTFVDPVAFFGHADSMTWRNENSDWNGWHAFDTVVNNWQLSANDTLKKVIVLYKRQNPYLEYSDSATTWLFVVSPVRANGRALPQVTRLFGAAPNPFFGTTHLRFDIASAQGAATVNISIYDLNGSLVRLLTNKILGVGSYNTKWDGTDNHGQRIGSGFYICRFEAGKYFATQKIYLAQ